MGDRNFKKRKKAWKRIYAKKFRRRLKQSNEKITKGNYRFNLKGHFWYDVFD